MAIAVYLSDSTDGGFRHHRHQSGISPAKLKVADGLSRRYRSRSERTGEMKKPVWLIVLTAWRIHDLMLAQHGGLAGVRDEGLLESALSRRETSWLIVRPRLRNWLPATPSASL